MVVVSNLPCGEEAPLQVPGPIVLSAFLLPIAEGALAVAEEATDKEVSTAV
jgi:hypothetical protein